MQSAPRHPLVPLSLALACVLLLSSTPAWAEWYVAGQLGANFAGRLADIGATGPLDHPEIVPRFSSLGLANSYVYGAKVGHFAGNGWFGLELDAFHTTPHIKQLAEVPGAHLRVTNIGVNFLARYPGLTYQPYVGIGPSLVIARVGTSPTTQRNTDVAAGLNLLAGLRAFVTPYMAVFTEYKYTQSTLRFDQAFGAVDGATAGFTGDYRAQQVLIGVSYHF